jgi:hypothetical protein
MYQRDLLSQSNAIFPFLLEQFGMSDVVDDAPQKPANKTFAVGSKLIQRCEAAQGSREILLSLLSMTKLY